MVVVFGEISLSVDLAGRVEDSISATFEFLKRLMLPTIIVLVETHPVDFRVRERPLLYLSRGSPDENVRALYLEKCRRCAVEGDFYVIASGCFSALAEELRSVWEATTRCVFLF